MNFKLRHYPFSATLACEKRDLADFRCHKILKSDPPALSKAGRRWYIPPATSWSLGPRVAFSGSLWTEATPSGRCPSHFGFSKRCQGFIAGWSSPVARQAHNLKVIGSNPIPATRQASDFMRFSESRPFGAAFLFLSRVATDTLTAVAVPGFFPQ